MKQRHNILLLLTLVLCGTIGCSSPPDLVINTYEYANGTTSGLIQADPEETLDAVKAATADVHVTIYDIQKSDDPRTYKVLAEEEDGRNITITIKQNAPDVTRLSVKVGFLGDKKKNDVLFERIADRLGLEPKALD